MDRQKVIVRTSVIGILANVFLAAFKAAVGTISHSIAIVLDAVNNLSDALSSVITIVGTKLAGKKPDKKHPYGHGRIEYITAMVISVIVLYAGVTSLVESIKKIIHPETPDYGVPALVIVGVAVLVKVVLGRFVGKTGEKVHSESLIASGKDALNDSIISAATLVAAAVYLLWHVSLEAWLGAVISVVIVKSGLDLLRETLSLILGERVDNELALAIKQTAAAVPGVGGAYDLILHSYGPEMTMGSIHVEVPDYLTAAEIDTLERQVVDAVLHEHGVILTGVSIYSHNTTDDEAAAIRENVRKLVMAHDHVLQMHGFYLHENLIQFDVVIGFDAADRRALCDQIIAEVRAAYPAYELRVTMDNDMSD